MALTIGHTPQIARAAEHLVVSAPAVAPVLETPLGPAPARAEQTRGGVAQWAMSVGRSLGMAAMAVVLAVNLGSTPAMAEPVRAAPVASAVAASPAASFIASASSKIDAAVASYKADKKQKSAALATLTSIAAQAKSIADDASQPARVRVQAMMTSSSAKFAACDNGLASFMGALGTSCFTDIGKAMTLHEQLGLPLDAADRVMVEAHARSVAAMSPWAFFIELKSDIDMKSEAKKSLRWIAKYPGDANLQVFGQRVAKATKDKALISAANAAVGRFDAATITRANALADSDKDRAAELKKD